MLELLQMAQNVYYVSMWSRTKEERDSGRPRNEREPSLWSCVVC